MTIQFERLPEVVPDAPAPAEPLPDPAEAAAAPIAEFPPPQALEQPLPQAVEQPPQPAALETPANTPVALPPVQFPAVPPEETTVAAVTPEAPRLEAVQRAAIRPHVPPVYTTRRPAAAPQTLSRQLHPSVTASHAVEPPATPAVPPSTPTATSQAELAKFQAEMRRAVTKALIYPAAARMAGQRGNARVSFDFTDGSVFNVALVAPSGLPLLDQAAIATIRAAHYPPPPTTLANRTVHLAINVTFNPDSPD